MSTDLQRALENANLTDAVRLYHEQAMKMNQSKQTGNLRRIIYLLSENPKKTVEFVKVMDRYGIEVFRAPVCLDRPEYIELLLEQSVSKAVKVLAVMKEDSQMVKLPEYGATWTSILQVWTLSKEGKVVIKQTHQEEQHGRWKYFHAESLARFMWLCISGYMIIKSFHYAPTDFSIQAVILLALALIPLLSFRKESLVFGWDDDFFPGELTPFTCHALKEMGIKVSPRDMNLSWYIQHFIYYTQRLNLNFHPVSMTRVIDFQSPVSAFIQTVPIYQLPTVQKYGFGHLFNRILADGVFFRSAINRREKNYWLPGLNAGIPLTPKDDPIHELTYLMHDFGHFLMRDLVFTGSLTTSPLHRQVFVLYRMMSEAITMWIADGLFVDALVKEDMEYDWGKRRIYPLFQATGLSFDSDNRLDSLYKLCYANVHYCLTGCDKEYKRLLGDSADGLVTLERFKEKYTPFMVEDYRWTLHNYDNMSKKSTEFQAWWQTVSTLGVLMETIDSFILKLDKDGELVDQIFKVIWKEQLLPVFTQGQKDDDERCPDDRDELKTGFLRYMCGQLGIFARYGLVLSECSDLYLKLILEELEAFKQDVTMERAIKIRSIYEEYVDVLHKQGIISSDDQHTFKEVYPLMDPCFVSYDYQKGTQNQLREMYMQL